MKKQELYNKRDFFNRICLLITQHPWILQKQEQFYALLGEFQTKAERSLFLDLLDDYCVVEESSLKWLLEGMARFISERTSQSNYTIVSAFTRSREPDSGQVIVQLLKPYLSMLEANRYSLINSLDKITDEVKKHPETDCIVLVDETVGSGRTLDNQLKYIKGLDRLKDKLILVCVVAAIESNIKTVIGGYSDVDLHCPLLLKKGITERYNGTSRISAVETMKLMESKLAVEVKGHKLEKYSFGYGGAEMLYAHLDWNAPNSMFPIFWWPQNKKGKNRHTIFFRSLD